MKKIILPILALAMFSFNTDSTKLTQEERNMLVDYLEESRDHMKTVIKGLSEEQLNFIPEKGGWSIANCVEHLAIAEKAFSGFIEKTVATEPNPALRDSLKLKDGQLMGLLTDRSQKFKTAEPFEPTGKFGSHKAAVKAFLALRKDHIAYVKTTEDDLRNRFNYDLPFGMVDGVQVIIFAAGHTERHILQMEAIIADPAFPGVN